MKNKKAFTVVELVIVIAIIAILAAVLIPTFASLIKKANVSKDQQLIRNLNTALATSQAERNNKPHANMTEALEAAEKFGYEVGKINTSGTDNEILWDSKNDLFCYLDNSVNGSTIEKIKYIPESVIQFEKNTDGGYVETKVNLVDYWVISKTISTEGYSTYLYGYIENGGATSIDNLTVGVDTGKENISSITYTGGESAQTVTIRTNSFYTTLTINAQNDTVKHYDCAKTVSVLAVADSSYHEFGTVPLLEIAGGHIVLERDSKVSIVYFLKNNNDEFKNANNQIISLDISALSSENMPAFTRDAVTIDENGTFVVKVLDQTNTSFIWLWGTGTQNEIVISNNNGPIASDGVLNANATVVGAEDGSIGDQIANIYNGSTHEFGLKLTKDDAFAIIDKAQGEEIEEAVKNGTANYEARIGGVAYFTFEEALVVANEIGTARITLLKDVEVEETINITSGKNIVIDFNDKTMTSNVPA